MIDMDMIAMDTATLILYGLILIMSGMLFSYIGITEEDIKGVFISMGGISLVGAGLYVLFESLNCCGANIL